MPLIHKEITINAPAERIFDVLKEPRRLPEYAPGVAEVTDIHETPERIGDTFKAVYSVMSLKMPLKFEVKELVEPSKSVAQMDGQMQGEWVWTLQSQGPATHVVVETNYRLKLGLLGRALNAVLVERMNEKNMEQMLANLKVLVER